MTNAEKFKEVFDEEIKPVWDDCGDTSSDCKQCDDKWCCKHWLESEWKKSE